MVIQSGAIRIGARGALRLRQSSIDRPQFPDSGDLCPENNAAFLTMKWLFPSLELHGVFTPLTHLFIRDRHVEKEAKGHAAWLIPLNIGEFPSDWSLVGLLTLYEIERLFSPTLKSLAMMTGNLLSPSKNAYSRWGGKSLSSASDGSSIDVPSDSFKTKNDPSGSSFPASSIPDFLYESIRKFSLDFFKNVIALPRME
ncbi:hypothetical protein Tco_0521965 [Tanacetum coccineum]